MAAKKTNNKKKTPAPLPTASDLAATFGVKLQKPLSKDTIWRFRKPVPGYVALLDDAAQLLKDEGAALQIPDVTPADMLAAQEEQKFLAAREAVLYSVYRSVYEQRLQTDDRAMKMLEKLARRVNALAEDDATLKTRWKVLLDFLSTFRPGAPTKGEPANTAPGEPSGDADLAKP